MQKIKILLISVGLLSFLACSTNFSLANEKERYIDRDLDISFVYPTNWVIADPVEEATRFVIRWETKQSKSLIATCYIRAVKNKDWELFSNNFPKYYDFLLNGFLEATRERSDRVHLISDQLTRLDGKDVLFTIFTAEIQNLDNVNKFRIFTVLTFWQEYEIALECGTELLDLDLNEFSDAEKPATIEFQNRIEKTIKQILSTLHFDRTG